MEKLPCGLDKAKTTNTLSSVHRTLWCVLCKHTTLSHANVIFIVCFDFVYYRLKIASFRHEPAFQGSISCAS